MGNIIGVTVDGVKRLGNDVIAGVTQPIGPATWVDRGVSDVRRTIRGVAREAKNMVVGTSRRRY